MVGGEFAFRKRNKFCESEHLETLATEILAFLRKNWGLGIFCTSFITMLFLFGPHLLSSQYLT